MPSKSIGSPTQGQLLGGVHLSDAPYLRGYPVYAGSDVRWGTSVLVGLVDRAAKSVRKQFPDAVLSVGHLSKAGGGELDRHASHESGRDADVGFYVKNASGKPMYGDQMVAFAGDGTAASWPGAHFDDARNWAFVAAVVGDGQAKVTHVFVATPIRERLLAYAAKVGAPLAVRVHASEVLAQPRGALPHDDHFHVRIGCPAGMDKCIEQPTGRARFAGRGSALATHGRSAAAVRVAPPTRLVPSGPVPHAAVPMPAHGAMAHAVPTKPMDRPPADHEEESANTDSLIPNLSPAVPGLDSAVIPTPLTGVRPRWESPKEQGPASRAPVSDPDGVLEHD